MTRKTVFLATLGAFFGGLAGASLPKRKGAAQVAVGAAAGALTFLGVDKATSQKVAATPEV